MPGTFQRAVVEEAQVAVEGFGGDELDFSKLAGLWRLDYTTASDVVRSDWSLLHLCGLCENLAGAGGWGSSEQ